jgi:minor extracellular serine protease Vpr
MARGSVLALLLVALAGCIAQAASADSGVANATNAAEAFAKYGATGNGVLVAILDRGIDYAHPDFRNPDGTTRIKYMLDMSGQNLCSQGNPAPVEYSAADIDDALRNGSPLAERDAVGHGTVTTGLAAGNGSAVGKRSAQYAGMAPRADLLIVKVTSEGAPAHDDQPPEAPFQACYDQALDWVAQKASNLGEPVVALINSGTQWGPIDGTSAVSRRIDADFSDTPGRAYVAASGDEGSLNNHARLMYSNADLATFNLSKATTATAYMQLWYTGSVPASITITLNDDGTVLTVPPGDNSGSKNGVTVFQYSPGQQFYPWQSSGPDRAVFIQIVGHSGSGTIQVTTTQPGPGTVDAYGDAVPNLTFTNALTDGRLTDYSATRSAIVTGASVVRTEWVDIDRVTQTLTNEGQIGQLWKFSSGGPTRDGRVPPNGGVDIVSPGANSFAAYARNSYWETFRSNLIKGGRGYYGRHSATSAAAPITVGAVALLLQMKPDLTAAQIKSILHSTAITDSNTGSTPNPDWGSGKLNVLGAENAVAAMIPANPVVSPERINFGSQPIDSTSPPKTITLTNTGTAALTITGIVAKKRDFKVESTTCGATLAASTACTIDVTFTPTQTGTRRGAVTITDFNPTSPQTVHLRGTGT